MYSTVLKWRDVTSQAYPGQNIFPCTTQVSSFTKTTKHVQKQSKKTFNMLLEVHSQWCTTATLSVWCYIQYTFFTWCSLNLFNLFLYVYYRHVGYKRKGGNIRTTTHPGGSCLCCVVTFPRIFKICGNVKIHKVQSLTFF